MTRSLASLRHVGPARYSRLWRHLARRAPSLALSHPRGARDRPRGHIASEPRRRPTPRPRSPRRRRLRRRARDVGRGRGHHRAPTDAPCGCRRSGARTRKTRLRREATCHECRRRHSRPRRVAARRAHGDDGIQLSLQPPRCRSPRSNREWRDRHTGEHPHGVRDPETLDPCVEAAARERWRRAARSCRASHRPRSLSARYGDRTRERRRSLHPIRARHSGTTTRPNERVCRSR